MRCSTPRRSRREPQLTGAFAGGVYLPTPGFVPDPGGLAKAYAALFGRRGIWAFGHQHRGLTLGPVTGRLLAEMMTGEAPFADTGPFAAERFG